MDEKPPSPSPDSGEREERGATPSDREEALPQDHPETRKEKTSSGNEGLSALERDMILAKGGRKARPPAPEITPTPKPEVHGTDRWEQLLDVTRRISQSLNLTDLMDQILDAVLDISRFERGFVLLDNAEEGRLDYVAGRDKTRTTIPREAAKYSYSIASDVFSKRRGVFKDGLDLPRSESINLLELDAIICLPLLGKRGGVGVLYLDSKNPGLLKKAEDQTLLEAFASQAAIAIENAQLHEEVEKQRDSLATENMFLRQEVKQAVAFENIVGQSEPMKKLFHAMDRFSDYGKPVLILGETGTGKDLIAKALHFHSSRRDGPYMKAVLTALSGDLVWSALFGHKKGAFTGAIEDKTGYFELADGGTLFLDEAGDLSPRVQVALLEVLDHGKINRLGEEDHPRWVDVRLISATHRDLQEMVKENKFREDLYFRLKGMQLDVPPLRDRGDDIRLICEHYLTKLAEEFKQPRNRLTPEAYRLIFGYRWPGNVRELIYAIERAVVQAGPGVPLGPSHFPDLAPPAGESDKGFSAEGTLKQKLEAAEKIILKGELEKFGWNISRCASSLDCSRQHLHNRIRRLGIQRPGKD